MGEDLSTAHPLISLAAEAGMDRFPQSTAWWQRWARCVQHSACCPLGMHQWECDLDPPRPLTSSSEQTCSYFCGSLMVIYARILSLTPCPGACYQLPLALHRDAGRVPQTPVFQPCWVPVGIEQNIQQPQSSQILFTTGFLIFKASQKRKPND